METKQAMNLVKGNLVQWTVPGQEDRGEVIEIQGGYITIEWEDGHTSKHHIMECARIEKTHESWAEYFSQYKKVGDK